MKKLLTLTAVGTILVCSDAIASGFNLKEQSAAAQGNAFAGIYGRGLQGCRKRNVRKAAEEDSEIRKCG